jgi:hypothetical protein
VNEAPSRPLVDGTHFVHAAVVVRRAPDAVLVLPLDDRAAEPIMLSGTGVAMWEAFARPSSPRAVAATLAREFSTDQDDVARAIAPVVAQLLAAGALTEAP